MPVSLISQARNSMQNNPRSRWGSSLTLTPIITIDDLQNIAQVLVKGLHKLGEYKYPLAIRKGVRSMAIQKGVSKTVKAGGITYFIDLKKTKKGKPYLMITESRFKGEGEERERKTLIVFSESVKAFSKAIGDMAAKLG